jgi:uncharacterized protein YndB with AHSA1/START domain
MEGKNTHKRTDTGSRDIMASPEKIYQAFLDPRSVAIWRPPEGMKCRIFEFDPREGGLFRMSFKYARAQHAVKGKTSPDADVFKGSFLKLEPNRGIVELIEFESKDPQYRGIMTVTTTLTEVPGGTRVTFLCENVPVGIKKEDHLMGMESTLRNLAAFTE